MIPTTPAIKSIQKFPLVAKANPENAIIKAPIANTCFLPIPSATRLNAKLMISPTNVRLMNNPICDAGILYSCKYRASTIVEPPKAKKRMKRCKIMIFVSKGEVNNE